MTESETKRRVGTIIVVAIILLILIFTLIAFTRGSKRDVVTIYNQPVGNDITITGAQFENPGYVVIYEDVRLSKENILGYSPLISGKENNITISLNSSLRPGKILYAVPHVDDGDGIYEGPEVDLPLNYRGKSLIVSFKVINYSESKNSPAATKQNYSTSVIYLGSSFTDSPTRIVALSNFNFSHPSILINQGDIIEFKNVEGGHSVTLADGTLDIVLDIGGSAQLKFNKPGVYDIYCRFHGSPKEGMKTVIVVQNSTFPS